MMTYGKFDLDNPQTEWFLGGQDEDRNMSTLRDFWFEDRDGKRWNAPKQTVTDGASIPRPLWSLIGSPFTGYYRRAAIVHDVACVQAGEDHKKRREADKMFFYACLTGRCSIAQAMILYIGVRFGAWLPVVDRWAPIRTIPNEPRLYFTATEIRLQRDFQEVAEIVRTPGDTDDAEELERRTDAAMERVTGLNVEAY